MTLCHNATLFSFKIFFSLPLELTDSALCYFTIRYFTFYKNLLQKHLLVAFSDSICTAASAGKTNVLAIAVVGNTHNFSPVTIFESLFKWREVWALCSAVELQVTQKHRHSYNNTKTIIRATYPQQQPTKTTSLHRWIGDRMTPRVHCETMFGHPAQLISQGPMFHPHTDKDSQYQNDNISLEIISNCIKN